jgi:hypothetical protein
MVFREQREYASSANDHEELIMGSEGKDEGCKVKDERRPSRAPGAPPKPDDVHKRGSVQAGISDADKKARTGSERESVRNTPPAGDWNDVA